MVTRLTLNSYSRGSKPSEGQGVIEPTNEPGGQNETVARHDERERYNIIYPNIKLDAVIYKLLRHPHTHGMNKPKYYTNYRLLTDRLLILKISRPGRILYRFRKTLYGWGIYRTRMFLRELSTINMEAHVTVIINCALCCNFNDKYSNLAHDKQTNGRADINYHAKHCRVTWHCECHKQRQQRRVNINTRNIYTVYQQINVTQYMTET